MVDGSLERTWSTFYYIRRIFELFSLSVTVMELRRNVYSSAVFARGRPLCTHFLSGQGRPPPTILGTRKLGILGYPVCSPILTQYRRVMDRHTYIQTDRQTDRQTNRFAVAYTALAKL